MAPEAQWTLPAAMPATNRTLYLFKGSTVDLDGHAMPVNYLARLRPESTVTLRNGKAESEFLLLQGKPIGEPVVQYGPFVMNSRAEIQQAFEDYQRTGFGGWPWPADDPVFEREQGRYARHADGKVEIVK
jgi:redox-sensitive bicupin YhaK (pirin superfamily)